ncbi:nuclear transport factor 2 [Sphaeramia orbicularis]|uniref:nuclear transport factor 2 n=1 Tax=Sphaeramia orbicularis TaxID=375764 RepID=UPI00117CB448|nr:nuclear transport factor 2-like [Sphaeramia orbicularis]
MEKLKSLPLTQIQHVVTAQDHHLLPDYIIMSSIIGQLKADNDPVIGFHQTFILRNINDGWVCINDNFRLAVHNFA